MKSAVPPVCHCAAVRKKNWNMPAAGITSCRIISGSSGIAIRQLTKDLICFCIQWRCSLCSWMAKGIKWKKNGVCVFFVSFARIYSTKCVQNSHEYDENQLPKSRCPPPEAFRPGTSRRSYKGTEQVACAQRQHPPGRAHTWEIWGA